MGDAAATGIGIWMRQHLAPGGTMIDVGANTGAFTALAADIVGPAGRVLAFEPAPENAAALRRRFANAAHVMIVEAAVTDRSGTAELFLDRQNATQHSLAAANVGRSAAVVQVRTVMLDDYAADLRRVDLVKIDAQGADLDVIRGAQRLLASHRPRLIVECWPFGLRGLGTDPLELIARLKGDGYDVYRLSTKGTLKPEAHILEFLATARRWNAINLAGVARA